MFKSLKILMLAIVASIGWSGVSNAASIDCTKATTETEIAICGDEELHD